MGAGKGNTMRDVQMMAVRVSKQVHTMARKIAAFSEPPPTIEEVLDEVLAKVLPEKLQQVLESTGRDSS
jgi:hypothetical protein